MSPPALLSAVFLAAAGFPATALGGLGMLALTSPTATASPAVLEERGRPPFESCSPGAPWWQAWRVFDTRVAAVESDEGLKRLHVKTKSVDSSAIASALWVARRLMGDEAEAAYEDTVFGCPPFWSKDHARCELNLSPFGEACVLAQPASSFLSTEAAVSVKWSAGGRRDWRAAAVAAAVVLHRSAAALSEAWHVHYAVGVSFGLVFFLLMALFFLANFVGATPGKRRLAVVASVLGYSAAVWHYFTRAAMGAVAAYPRLALAYAGVAVAASVLATRAVRASEVFFDAIYFSCRALAIAAAFNATASVGCGASLAVLFVVSNALDARPLFAFVFETAREGASYMTSPSRDASNFLHGHAFQTPRAFHDSGRDHARDGLAELAKTPEFAAWVAANHQNIRFGPPEGDDDL